MCVPTQRQKFTIFVNSTTDIQKQVMQFEALLLQNIGYYPQSPFFAAKRRGDNRAFSTAIFERSRSCDGQTSKVPFQMWYKHMPFVSVLDVLIVHTGGIQLVLKSTPLSFEIDTSHVIPSLVWFITVWREEQPEEAANV